MAKSVLLPAPLGPSRNVSVPASNEADTWRRARVAPKRRVTPRTSMRETCIGAQVTTARLSWQDPQENPGAYLGSAGAAVRALTALAGARKRRQKGVGVRRHFVDLAVFSAFVMAADLVLRCRSHVVVRL